MEREPVRNKIDAIYELREAVERKAAAEFELAATGTAIARDALLEAQLSVESKTQAAIDVCHECGEAHIEAEPHRPATISDRYDNVISVDFGRDAKSV